MSHISVRSNPPAMAGPPTAAITGWVQNMIARYARWNSAVNSSLVSFLMVLMKSRSKPAENIFSPPVSTTTWTSSFTLSSLNVASSSARTSGERELPLSGRLMVTVATRSVIDRVRYCASMTASCELFDTDILLHNRFGPWRALEYNSRRRLTCLHRCRGKEVREMTTLLTYVSNTGNTRKVAEAIYDELPDEKEIKEISEVSSREGYDLSFIGFPINANGPNPKAAEFLEKSTAGRKIAIFITHGAPAAVLRHFSFQTSTSSCSTGAPDVMKMAILRPAVLFSRNSAALGLGPFAFMGKPMKLRSYPSRLDTSDISLISFSSGSSS